MNNLPLQPLPWESVKYSGGAANDAQGAGIYYRAIQRDGKHIVYWVDSMGGSDGNKEFDSLDELKHWVNTDHYPHKMQPYVKPSPTWIDVNERFPEDDGKYLVATSCGKQWMGNYNLPPKPNEWMLNGWSMNGGWHPFDITHWMPIPEFSTMQNNKGE